MKDKLIFLTLLIVLITARTPTGGQAQTTQYGGNDIATDVQRAQPITRADAYMLKYKADSIAQLIEDSLRNAFGRKVDTGTLKSFMSKAEAQPIIDSMLDVIGTYHAQDYQIAVEALNRAMTPGPPGVAGPQGNIGPSGPQGAKGIPGARGAGGPVGPQGIAGTDGATGPTGPTGPTGATGPQGSAGIVGPQGFQGIPGTNGTNALVTLTSTGTSGVATYNSTTGALNIPNYGSNFAISATTIGLSKATLNSTYSTSSVGFMVMCPSITLGGAIYIRVTAGTSGVWQAISAPPAL